MSVMCSMRLYSQVCLHSRGEAIDSVCPCVYLCLINAFQIDESMVAGMMENAMPNANG